MYCLLFLFEKRGSFESLASLDYAQACKIRTHNIYICILENIAQRDAFESRFVIEKKRDREKKKNQQPQRQIFDFLF